MDRITDLRMTIAWSIIYKDGATLPITVGLAWGEDGFEVDFEGDLLTIEWEDTAADVDYKLDDVLDECLFCGERYPPYQNCPNCGDEDYNYSVDRYDPKEDTWT